MTSAHEGQRLAPVVYYCAERKKYFKRNVLIDDELEIRRKLNAVVLLLRTAWNGHKYLMIKTIDGREPRFSTGSKSIPAYLFGPEFRLAHRISPNIWDLTRSAYGIKAGLQQATADVIINA